MTNGVKIIMKIKKKMILGMIINLKMRITILNNKSQIVKKIKSKKIK